MTPEDFASRVQGRASGDGQWEGKCPSHADNVRSLSIGTGRDGRTLLRCHAGCTAEEITLALGLLMEDLMPDDQPRKGGELGDPDYVYPYTDEKGDLLFEVLRFPGKKFRQRAADGTWSLKGVRRVPYHLPQLLAAVKAGHPVLVVEGEKDVHSAEAIGQPATTAPGGAGKWDDGWAYYFNGAQVVVVADKDESGVGLAHARQVVESIQNVAAQVWLAEAAAGKDLTDHLAAGFDINMLHYLPLEAPEDDEPAFAGIELVVGSKPPPPDGWPEQMSDAAFHGPLGHAALVMSETSEASPEAILASLMTAVGAMVGLGPYVELGDSRYGLNLYVILVGPSALGRKGASWNTAKRVLWGLDGDFLKHRASGGFGSGESLVDFIGAEGEDGRQDFRLLYHEPEMGRVLKAGGRDGAQMSEILRSAWDGGPLQARARYANKGGSKADQSHVALLGHVTPADLTLLKPADLRNGFANRFLYVASFIHQVRSPRMAGASAETVEQLRAPIRSAIVRAKRPGPVRLDTEAAAKVDAMYLDSFKSTSYEPTLVEDLAGSRRFANLMRLAGLYAVLDHGEISVAHLDAATAVLDYSARTVEYVFGEGYAIRAGSDAKPTYDDEERLLDALHRAGAKGLSGVERQKVFHNRMGRAKMNEIIAKLEHQRVAKRDGTGRLYLVTPELGS